MAGHAVCPEREDMFRGKDLIDAQVAVGTRHLIEWSGITIDVTVFAREGGAIRFCFVSR